MFSCCTADNVFNAQTNVDEIALKGDDLKIDKELQVPAELKAMKDLIGFWPGDWGMNVQMQ